MSERHGFVELLAKEICHQMSHTDRSCDWHGHRCAAPASFSGGADRIRWQQLLAASAWRLGDFWAVVRQALCCLPRQAGATHGIRRSVAAREAEARIFAGVPLSSFCAICADTDAVGALAMPCLAAIRVRARWYADVRAAGSRVATTPPIPSEVVPRLSG